MKEVFDYIDSHVQEAIDDLFRLCRQPSIGAQGIGLTETANLVAEMMQQCGIISAQILPTPGGGPSVVYGELEGESSTTLLFYNHYDVQPPEPLELWTTPPFEPTIYDGHIRGRGVSDNKGNIVARLAVIKAYQALGRKLPVSVKFCIDGEEEVGSPHLPPFVEQHRSLLKADLCLWEGGSVNWLGQPVISLGVKGILYTELEVRTASRDAHSSLGTIVPNAAWRLTWALSTLKDRDENILIEGFYDDVRPATELEMEAVRAMPSEEEIMKENLGLRGFLKDIDGVDLRARNLFAPTCTICGLVAGYTGQGPKTVLPGVAKAKVDFRMVPRQDPQDIIAKLRKHLDKHGFEDISITVLHGKAAARTSLDSPFVGVFRQAVRDVHGVDPVVMPTVAGSGPVFFFADSLGIPTISSVVCHSDRKAHAPNENIRIDYFVKGIKLVAALMNRLGEG